MMGDPHYFCLTIYFITRNIIACKINKCHKRAVMKLRAFFRNHPVFTVEDFAGFLSSDGTHNLRTQESLLTYHVKAGNIVRVRRGLYASVPPRGRPRKPIRSIHIFLPPEWQRTPYWPTIRPWSFTARPIPFMSASRISAANPCPSSAFALISSNASACLKPLSKRMQHPSTS